MFNFSKTFQGILDPNEDSKDGVENDEILEELVRCQNELKAVSTHNLSQLKRLMKVRTLKFSSYMMRQFLIFLFYRFFMTFCNNFYKPTIIEYFFKNKHFATIETVFLNLFL